MSSGAKPLTCSGLDHCRHGSLSEFVGVQILLELQELFHLPQKVAAKEYGLCLTYFKVAPKSTAQPRSTT